MTKPQPVRTYHDWRYDYLPAQVRRAYWIGGMIGSLSTFGLIIVLLILKELGA